VTRRSTEWTVYNADKKKFVIYAGHFDGEEAISLRVMRVLCKSDGEIGNKYRILVDDLFSLRSVGSKVDIGLGGKHYDGFDMGDTSR
jgi:hypothetical protein